MVVQQLAEQKKWDDLTRTTLIGLAGDATTAIRGAAYQALAKVKLDPHEIITLESFLTRKSNDVRQGILPLLLAQPDNDALASADRLMAAGDAQKRLAGLEVLRQMSLKNRCRDQCQAGAEAYRTGRHKLTGEEQVQLEGILDSVQDALKLDNGLGLFDPSQRSLLVAPTDRKVKFLTDAAVACVRSLDDLIHEHRETTIKFKNWRGEEHEQLLGNMTYGLRHPDPKKPIDKQAEHLPLREVWEKWLGGRPRLLCDKDGCECIRAAMWLEVLCSGQWARATKATKASPEWQPLPGAAGLRPGNRHAKIPANRAGRCPLAHFSSSA